MVDLLKATFPLKIVIAEKVIIVLRSLLSFLDLKGTQTIDLIVFIWVFFDLIIRRNKAKSGANFGSRSLLVTL